MQKNPYTNNLKNAKKVNKMPFFLTKLPKIYTHDSCWGGHNASRGLQRCNLSRNNLVGTRVCILDNFFRAIFVQSLNQKSHPYNYILRYRA